MNTAETGTATHLLTLSTVTFGLMPGLAVIGEFAGRADGPSRRGLLRGANRGLLGIHLVINVGMNIDLLPVTGVPLPCLSYGGSFVRSCFLLLGLV